VFTPERLGSELQIFSGGAEAPLFSRERILGLAAIALDVAGADGRPFFDWSDVMFLHRLAGAFAGGTVHQALQAKRLQYLADDLARLLPPAGTPWFVLSWEDEYTVGGVRYDGGVHE
jgi:hypothetical protein